LCNGKIKIIQPQRTVVDCYGNRVVYSAYKYPIKWLFTFRLTMFQFKQHVFFLFVRRLCSPQVMYAQYAAWSQVLSKPFHFLLAVMFSHP